MVPYDKRLKRLAQELRRNATPQENKLWYEFLRKHPCRFARQKPIERYIVDFYCPTAKLVIEIDGNQHGTAEGLERDRMRAETLEGLGLHVMRFSNDEISRSFYEVCTVIQQSLDAGFASAGERKKTPGLARPPSFAKEGKAEP